MSELAETSNIICSMLFFLLQKRDIILFTVDIAKIRRKLESAEHGKPIHPIGLSNVKSASDPQGGAVETYWCDHNITIYGFPLGKPLSHSSGNIADYDPPTGQLLYHHALINCET